MLLSPITPRLGWHLRFAFGVGLAFLACLTASAAPLKVLFLGDNGHHQPAARLLELRPAMKARGIEITYTEDVATALTLDTLKRYDALMLFANIDRIAPE